jgi:hypothetical protein
MARATFHKVTSSDGKALGSVQRVHRFGRSMYQAWAMVARTGDRMHLGFFDYRDEAESAILTFSREAFSVEGAR